MGVFPGKGCAAARRMGSTKCKCVLGGMDRGGTVGRSCDPCFYFGLGMAGRVDGVLHISFFTGGVFEDCPHERSGHGPNSCVRLGGQFFFKLRLSLALWYLKDCRGVFGVFICVNGCPFSEVQFIRKRI